MRAIAAVLVILLTLPGAAFAAKPADVAAAVAEAQSAVERAEAADAAQYAGESLQRARESVRQAQALAGARKHDDALAQAQLAAADADLALARSREAVNLAELRQRQDEVRALRVKLGMEVGR